MSETTKWPLRARFAHWVLGLISPWLELTPEEPGEWDEDDGGIEAAGHYDAGHEAGYRQAMEDARWER